MLAFYFCAAKSWLSSGDDCTSGNRLFIVWSMIIPVAAFIAALRGLVALRLLARANLSRRPKSRLVASRILGMGRLGGGVCVSTELRSFVATDGA